MKILQNKNLRLANGVVNSIHGLLHLFQVLLSILFLSNINDEIIHSIFENPLMSVFWGIFGIISLIIGIKDFMHHKKCDD